MRALRPPTRRVRRRRVGDAHLRAQELAPAISLLGDIIERFDSVTETAEPLRDGTDDGCYICKSLDATLTFETAATNDVL